MNPFTQQGRKSGKFTPQIVLNASNLPSVSPGKQVLHHRVVGNNVNAMPKLKTKKEVIASVTDYFLHSPISDEQKEASSEEFEKSEIKHRVVIPLRHAFLSKVPTNDSFIEMYKRKQMHDITLHFEKDGTTIDAHKIVLCTSERFKEYIQEQICNSKSGNISKINVSQEYDPIVFSKVLKLMYLGAEK